MLHSLMIGDTYIDLKIAIYLNLFKQNAPNFTQLRDAEDIQDIIHIILT